jgi:hypothetical protein
MMLWLPNQDLDDIMAEVLRRCIASLQEYGGTRKEYVLLSLHTLETVFNQMEPT